ncbi:UPF0182 family protein, partial [Streptococcus anginosus]|uniref:UPF0182 family protein n=1 Tax=Streptococcus anginosus TaxID=1328 RepID=UPI0021F8FE3F
ILMSAFGYLSAALAIKARPSNADGTYIRIKGNVIDLKQGISSKLALHVAGIFSLIVGAVFGFKFYNHWAQILLMFNAQPFGIKDPQFGIDNGFYVFVLPGLRLFISAFVLLLVISFVFSIITHLLMGAIRFSMPIDGKGILSITKRARRQISIWFMLVILTWALQQILDMFALVTLDGPRITGGSYTDMNAGVPGSIAMAVITVLVGSVIAFWFMKSHALSVEAPISVRFKTAVKACKTPTIAL